VRLFESRIDDEREFNSLNDGREREIEEEG